MRRPVLLLVSLPLAAGLWAFAARFVPDARAEELPPQVQQALTLAAEFPAPDASLGFVFHAQGQRMDAQGKVAAEVEFTLRVEPVAEGGLKAWKTSEIWSAKSAQATSRRTVDALLAADLTPLKGGTFEDGTASPTTVEWLGGEKVLALQVKGQDRRVLRSAWYAGQPVVEVGGAVLLARLLPRSFPRCQIDFCGPSWNKLTGEAQRFVGLALATSEGPTIQILPAGATEARELRTVSVQGYRDTHTLVFSVLLDETSGLPMMVMVNGATYAGDSRPL